MYYAMLQNEKTGTSRRHRELGIGSTKCEPSIKVLYSNSAAKPIITAPATAPTTALDAPTATAPLVFPPAVELADAPLIVPVELPLLLPVALAVPDALAELELGGAALSIAETLVHAAAALAEVSFWLYGR